MSLWLLGAGTLFSQKGIGGLLGPIFDRAIDVNLGIHPGIRSRGHQLVMVSDFGGRSKAQSYQTYAFLTFDLDKNFRWLHGQRLFRQTRLQRRRMSFKTMNDAYRRRALVPFLQLADTIIGWLVIFAVPRRGGSLFQSSIETPSTERALLNIWKPEVQEELLRILHFSSFLLSGLSAPRQDVLWIIDEDAVAANAGQLVRLTDLLGQISSHYLGHDLGNLRCGTTRSDDGTMSFEDAAAIPDLAAGAFSEIGTAMAAQGLLPVSKIAAPLPKNLAWKSRVLATWLASDTGSLQRLTYVMRVEKGSPGIGVTALKWHAIPGRMLMPYQRLSRFGP